MFTKRFIKMPIKLHNRELEEMTGQHQEIDGYEMVNPFNIASYRPSVEPEGCTYITFKSGDGMIVYLQIEEFENLLNSQA